MMSASTTATFNASTAGRNWILANQPNQTCMLPVKSRNSSVMNKKQKRAAMILNFLSITGFIFLEGHLIPTIL